MAKTLVVSLNDKEEYILNKALRHMLKTSKAVEDDFLKFADEGDSIHYFKDALKFHNEAKVIQKVIDCLVNDEKEDEDDE